MPVNGAELPTADRDVSGSASALRSVPCACGGEVTANPENPEPGVSMHNHSLMHLIWRFYERPEGPEQ